MAGLFGMVPPGAQMVGMDGGVGDGAGGASVVSPVHPSSMVAPLPVGPDGRVVIDPGQLERAVVMALGPNKVPDDDGSFAATKAAAESFCTSVQASPAAWEPCLSLFVGTSEPLVRFFCLQVLESTLRNGWYSTLPEEATVQFRGMLLQWARDNAGAGGILATQGAFVKNKLALVLVLALKHDFPERWPTAFSDLLVQLDGDASLVDLYLRVLTTIDEEIVQQQQQQQQMDATGAGAAGAGAAGGAAAADGGASGADASGHHLVSAAGGASSVLGARNGAIKDAMRAPGILDEMAEHWLSTLTTYREASPAVAEACLNVMDRYIGWIPIELVANDSFVPVLFDLMSTEDLRIGACGCMYEMVTKGMDPPSKLDLLRQLRIVEVLDAVDFGGGIGGSGVAGAGAGAGAAGGAAADLDPSDEDFFADVSELVGAVGQELLKAWQYCGIRYARFELDGGASLALEDGGHPGAAVLEPSQLAEGTAYAAMQLRRVINLTVAMLGHPSREIAQQVLTFVDDILNVLKKELGRGSGAGGGGSGGGGGRGRSGKADGRRQRSGCLDDLDSAESSASMGGGVGDAPAYRARAGSRTVVGVGYGNPGDNGTGATARDGGRRSSMPDVAPAGLRMAEFAPALLETVALRLSYPRDVDGGGGGGGGGGSADGVFDTDEEQAAFDDFRKKLTKAFVNMTRILPDASLTLLEAMFAPKIGALGDMAFQDSELLLTLVYLFGEGVPPAALDGYAGAGGPVHSLVCAIHESSVTKHGSHLVLEAYLELTYRYVKVLHTRPDLLPVALGAMLGESGLRNAHPTVRSRAAYFLQRVVKSFADSYELAAPLSRHILDGVQEFLPIPFATALGMPGDDGSAAGAGAGAGGGDAAAAGIGGGGEATSSSQLLSATDQGYLYEVVGLLVAAPWMPADQQVAFLSAVILPLLEQLHEGLSRAASIRSAAAAAAAATDPSLMPGADGHEAGVAEWSQRLLGAVGYVTKGLRREVEAEVAELLERVVSGAVESMAVLPGQNDVRKQVFFLMHRMVECLGERLVPLLHRVMPHLMEGSTVTSLQDLLRLVDQAMSRFGATPDMATFVEAHLLGISGRVFDVMPPVDAAVAVAGDGSGGAAAAAAAAAFARTDDAFERLDLQRAYFLFLQYVPLHGLAGVLLRESLAPYLLDMLNTIVQASVTVPDAAVRKVCFSSLRHFVDWWVPPGRAESEAPGAITVPLSGDVLNAFVAFLFDSVAPALFATALSVDYNPADAQYAQVASEVTALQALLARRLHGEAEGVPNFLEHLAKTVLPAVGCAEASAASYCLAVRSSLDSPKQLKSGYRQLVAALRAARGGATVGVAATPPRPPAPAPGTPSRDVSL